MLVSEGQSGIASGRWWASTFPGLMIFLWALAFNLVPLCREGVPFKAIRKAVIIVLVVLGVAAALGVGTAFLYVEYLETLR